MLGLNGARCEMWRSSNFLFPRPPLPMSVKACFRQLRRNGPCWTYTLPMRAALFVVFLVSATAVYAQSNQPDAMMARWNKAQTYASEGFQPISYFAGQV